MLINKRAVKQFVQENRKQASREFIERLEAKVKELILSAVNNGKNFKRLTEKELI
jgi:hypothetical protein